MRSHHPDGAPKKEQSSSLALSPKDSLKRQEASFESPISRVASSCSQSQEGKVKGIGRVMCGQEPLSHHPPALNREQGLHPQPGRTHGEEQKKRSSALGGWRPTKEGKPISTKPGFPRCQLRPSSPAGKREVYGPNLTRSSSTMRTSCTHVSWNQVVMTHC